MQRPTGVTVLAVLDFLAAGLQLLGAIGAFVGGALFGAILTRAIARSGGATMGAGLGAAIGAAIGVGLLIFACISGLLGWGMWTLKDWARILQIVFAGLGGLFQVLGFLTSLFHIHVFLLLWHLIWLAIYGGIIYYLIQPHVRAAFVSRPAAAYAPPAPPVAGA